MGRYICDKCGASLDAGERVCPDCGNSGRKNNTDRYNSLMQQAQNKKPELRNVYYIYQGQELLKVCRSVQEAREALSVHPKAYLEQRVEIAN